MGIVVYLFINKSIKDKEKSQNVTTIGGYPIRKMLIILIILLLALSFVRIVPPGYVAVQVSFGSVLNATLENGIHFVMPYVNFVILDVRWTEYTMSGISREGRYSGDDAIKVLTQEGLEIALDMTAIYRLDAKKAQRVYQEIGPNYEQKIVRPILRTAIRDVGARYSVKDIYSDKRTEISDQIIDVINEPLKEKGIEIDKILLRNVNLPEKIKEAIENKQAAEQKIQEMQNQIMISEKEADRKRAEARGIADANRIIGLGLTRRYLEWYRIDMMKKLVDSPNNTVIFLPTDTAAMPLVNINPSGSTGGK